MAGIHCPACHQGYINSLIPRCLGRVQGQPERNSSQPRSSGLGYADLPGQVQGKLCHSRCTTRVAHAQQSVRRDASRIIRVVQHVEEVDVELQVRPLPDLSCFHYFRRVANEWTSRLNSDGGDLRSQMLWPEKIRYGMVNGVGKLYR